MVNVYGVMIIQIFKYLSTFLSSKDGPRLYYLKLSSDQRSLVFDLYESSAENGSVRSGAEPSSIQPIDMSKVLMTEVHQEGGDKKGYKFLYSFVFLSTVHLNFRLLTFR